MSAFDQYPFASPRNPYSLASLSILIRPFRSRFTSSVSSKVSRGMVFMSVYDPFRFLGEVSAIG